MRKVPAAKMGHQRFTAIVVVGILVVRSSNAFPGKNGESSSKIQTDFRVGYNESSSSLECNKIIDKILRFSREPIRQCGLDRYTLPDFKKKFSKGVGICKMEGSFKGTELWLEKLSTINRKGDARLTFDGTTMRFNSTLGFDELRLGMVYSARLSCMGIKGKLKADVGENALSFTGGMEFSSAGDCRPFLENLKLQELKDTKVHVTGLGILNGMYSKIATWASELLHKYVQNAVENKIRKIVEKQLDKIKCHSG